ANLLQGSRSTFSWGSFPRFFAFKEGMWGHTNFGTFEFANSIPSLFCDSALLTFELHCRVWVLTVYRLRHITSPSWHPSIAENGYGAKLPTNPASMSLSEHNAMCINGEVPRHWSQPEKECAQWTWRNSNNA